MNPATMQQKKVYEANLGMLGGDFADWCRGHHVRAGDSLRIVWGTGPSDKPRPGRTVVVRVSAIGDCKILAVNGDVEVCLASEDWLVFSIEAAG